MNDMSIKEKYDLCMRMSDRVKRAKCMSALNRELIRRGLQAELDAINMYENIAQITNSNLIRSVVEDIIKEEKQHVGEFISILVMIDEDQMEGLKKGREEVEEIRD